jgi:hypothetical protein
VAVTMQMVGAFIEEDQRLLVDLDTRRGQRVVELAQRRRF